MFHILNNILLRLVKMDYNPNLKLWSRSKPNQVAGKGNIELPDDVENIVHQTRENPPTDYENGLASALAEIFDNDISELSDIIMELNKRGIYAPDGSPWIEKSFKSEIKRLGA